MNGDGKEREPWTDTQRQKTHKFSWWKVMKGRSQEFRELTEAAVAGPEGGSHPEGSLQVRLRLGHTMCLAESVGAGAWHIFCSRRCSKPRESALVGVKVLNVKQAGFF